MPYHQFIPRETKSCPDCKKPWISFGWCKDCETNSMKGNFYYWTSGNKEIDELIRHTQLSTIQACDYLEWIPFDNFEFVKFIESGEFNNIYSAIWMKGPRSNWNNTFKEWTRAGPTKVALKRLDNSLNISSSYVDRIKMYHKYIKSASLAETFGITRDSTSNYMIVMKYYENGNLNLHGGNLLVEDEMNVSISDMGPSYINFENRNLNQIYGVLPYIAPEILRGEKITIASDIYSFGIIMYTFAAGKRPRYNRAHNISLAKDICDGERLEIPGDTPDFYANLMLQCWDNDPDCN
ncbi:kinase-like domain-containing protein [Rhizophagus diaphanus]|nr:kinase-like domain-containing protein [Rhizophagus diaphanus] [Rhizophagus sp. MUCL 43196]